MNAKALLMAAITVMIWGSTFAGIRVSLNGGYSPGHLILVRYLIGSALFIIYALWPGVKFQLPQKKDLLKILFLGWIGISIYHIGVTFGEQTISAGTAGMLVGAAPIFTAIIASIVLKEELGLYGWLGLSIGFIGIILITLGTAGSSFTISEGAIFVLISALATSIFFVFQKPFFKRYKPIELTAYFTWAGTIPFFIFAPGVFQTIQHATLEASLTAIYVGVFPGAIAYVMWAIALSLSKASSITSILYLEPAIAILVAWVWLREFPSSLSLIGGIVAISGVLIVNVKRSKKTANNVMSKAS
ncbi:DMT family transporter [Bacillus sp. FJAT-49732]|uniref:DMT family transporter n=1 Tax=Lederbergia citrisecunda TaxID=2833583 RepID=A0A942TQL3_9BACI|nr:DMT family transporter [Lederbergia citrisecunda]MBS4201091.1 DMT family transporter [Lederbergia citrisecunda]